MDELDLAVSLLKTEMEKLKKENEFLKYKNGFLKKIHVYQRKALEKIFITNAAFKEMFDIEIQRLLIDKIIDKN